MHPHKACASLTHVNIYRIALLILLVLAVVLFFALDFGRFFDLERLQAGKSEYLALCGRHPWSCWLSYFALYTLVTGLSIPVAGVLTLLAGALFPMHYAIPLISLSSTLGACIAFALARYLFHDWVQQRFARQLTALNEGVEREGALYLFSLRIIPLFPFLLVNAAMALTSIPIRTFAWVSLIGMFPMTVVFINAGRELANITNLGDLLSLSLIVSLTLIGLLPLLSKKAFQLMRRKREGSKEVFPDSEKTK
ncbi:MAG: TVP38/TMEM64 family protein [Candidatus Eutrophobiaceae bacterium]